MMTKLVSSEASAEESLPRQEQTKREWHALQAAEAFAAFESSEDGLSAGEAARRKDRYGPNRLPREKPRGAWLRFLAQFHNLLIYVLLAAAVLAWLIGHGTDALVILGVVFANALIGFVQEGKAESALDAIRSMIDPRASVVRGGRRLTIPADEIVPGDVVLLEAGDRVPADLRLFRARNLRIDEAVLTGESVAAEKSVKPVDRYAPLGDRFCMAFSGSFVAAGQGAGAAVATGPKTELGRISTMISSVKSLKTPLVRQMDQFAKQITFVILALAGLVFAFAALARGYEWAEAFMAVVGIIVAAIPEGLPAVMTITLSVGVQRMAARNAIMRRLPVVETLGAVSVICSDKTGTLTRNEMTVRAVETAGRSFEVTGVGYEPVGDFLADGVSVAPQDEPVLKEIALAGLLCNDASLRHEEGTWIADGDPMEGALVSLGVKAGYDAGLTRKQIPRKDEIPFDSEHRYMATLQHSHEDGAFACVKGAPERVLAMCGKQRSPSGGEEPIDRGFWRERTDALASQGQRVLALAVKPVPQHEQDLTFASVEQDLTLLGLTGLIDPPREEAIAAVRECRASGVRVKMITGDHAATAAAIARQLGLEDEVRVLTGQELDELDDEGLRTAADETAVFARTSPEHKLRLVEALQAGGAVIAMTGDGVNDAPALKRADSRRGHGREGYRGRQGSG